MRRSFLAALVACAAAPRAAAQGVPAPSATAVVALVPAAAGLPLYQRPWVRPLASLLVPGSGQLLARHPRGVVYLATEIWLLARAVALSQDSRRERDQYRDLAYQVARHHPSANGAVGPFSSYEEMAKYAESGTFDLNPGPAFAPETDTSSFNGSVWRLARETFFENPDSVPDPGSPAMEAALRFYRRRAVTEGFRWSWHDARLEQDAFRASIRASDAAYRAATNYLGAILLNHLVSAVDSYVTTRLGRSGAIPRVSAAAGPGSLVLLWHASF